MRDYELEKTRLVGQLEECSNDHPLQALVTVSRERECVCVRGGFILHSVCLRCVYIVSLAMHNSSMLLYEYKSSCKPYQSNNDPPPPPPQAVEAGSVKRGRKSKDPSVAESHDPLSSSSSPSLSGGGGGGDPLSLPPSNDPLSAALLDPLSKAAAEQHSFGKKPEAVCVCVCVCVELTNVFLYDSFCHIEGMCMQVYLQ